MKLAYLQSPNGSPSPSNNQSKGATLFKNPKDAAHFIDIACCVSSRCMLLPSKVAEQCFPYWRKVLPINGASTLAKFWWLLLPPFQSGSRVILFQPRVCALKTWQCGCCSKNLVAWSVFQTYGAFLLEKPQWCVPQEKSSMVVRLYCLKENLQLCMLEKNPHHEACVVCSSER